MPTSPPGESAPVSACAPHAATQHGLQFTAFGLAEIDQISYVHRCLRTVGGPDESTVRAMSFSENRFTGKQGQYLAFIDAYTHVNRRPPAQADMQRYLRVSPPSPPLMLLTRDRTALLPPPPDKPHRTPSPAY